MLLRVVLLLLGLWSWFWASDRRSMHISRLATKNKFLYLGPCVEEGAMLVVVDNLGSVVGR